MKIAMLGHKRIPSREGGVEIVVEALAERMVAAGHHVTVYNRKGKHVSGEDVFSSKKRYEYKGIQIVTVPTFEKKSLNAIVYAFFATLKASFSKAEVLHFHAEGPCAMLPIAKIFRKRCVATIHGLDWQRAKWGGFATRFLKFGEKMAAKHADEVIVLSKGVQEYFRSTYNRETVLIPNGIERPEIRKPELIEKEYGLKGQDYILFLARLVPEKAAHTLMEAYQKSGVKIPLVVAGGSSHSDEYEEEIKTLCKNINDNPDTKGKIIMTGFVQGQKIQELYSNCLCYVLPSEIEGMPLSLLEAMSYGKLCITSDISENTDVTGGYGMSFPVGDVEKLSQLLKQIEEQGAGLYDTAQYKPEIIADSVLERFSWNDVVERTVNIYESVNGK